MRRLAPLFVLAAAASIGMPQVPSAFQFHFTDKPGAYAVGLKVVEQYDSSRKFRDEGGNPEKDSSAGPRPLQTLIWYPATKAIGSAMTFGDYAALVKTETSFGKPVEHGKPQDFVAAFMHGTTALSATAVRDAGMQAGKFPVVIYAPSVNSPSTENIELCEYLASNGFVVLASPSMGATSRAMTLDVSGANAEALDIAFLIDFARTLSDTDASKVAAIGYSWGGMSALFAAARDKSIGALVSLDGSFRYSPVTVQKAGDIMPDRMRIPLLFFSRAEEPLESWSAAHQDRDQFAVAPSVLNEWTQGDLFHLHLLAISHIQFSSLYERSERFQREGIHFVPADYSLEEGAMSYNWMARYTLEFLDAYLKRDAAAMLFMKRTPAENGVPKHLIASTFRGSSTASGTGGVSEKE